mmetsp:Transcript_103744/g.300032  ORF Transcript_103744/g.300032 Transcript_103744/m.300032 type:complete len:216 (-) Transcript_103744:135-782(-)
MRYRPLAAKSSATPLASQAGLRGCARDRGTSYSLVSSSASSASCGSGLLGCMAAPNGGGAPPPCSGCSAAGGAGAGSRGVFQGAGFLGPGSGVGAGGGGGEGVGVVAGAGVVVGAGVGTGIISTGSGMGTGQQRHTGHWDRSMWSQCCSVGLPSFAKACTRSLSSRRPSASGNGVVVEWSPSYLTQHGQPRMQKLLDAICQMGVAASPKPSFSAQ